MLKREARTVAAFVYKVMLHPDKSKVRCYLSLFGQDVTLQ